LLGGKPRRRPLNARDAGCGTGYGSAILAPTGATVVGVAKDVLPAQPDLNAEASPSRLPTSPSCHVALVGQHAWLVEIPSSEQHRATSMVEVESVATLPDTEPSRLRLAGDQQLLSSAAAARLGELFNGGHRPS
jgi:hypothetical protein